MITLFGTNSWNEFGLTIKHWGFSFQSLDVSPAPHFILRTLSQPHHPEAWVSSTVLVTVVWWSVGRLLRKLPQELEVKTAVLVFTKSACCSAAQCWSLAFSSKSSDSWGKLGVSTHKLQAAFFFLSRADWCGLLGKVRIPECGRGCVSGVPRSSIFSENWRIKFITRQCWSQFCLLALVKKILFNLLELVLPVSKMRRR